MKNIPMSKKYFIEKHKEHLEKYKAPIEYIVMEREKFREFLKNMEDIDEKDLPEIDLDKYETLFGMKLIFKENCCVM